MSEPIDAYDHDDCLHHKEIMQKVKALFDEEPEMFCAETEQEYIKALESLSYEWTRASDLPVNFAYYDTLAQAKLIERKNEPVYYGKTPRGFRIYFRLRRSHA